MKIINDMLFANQIFADVKETKPIAINLLNVDSFRCIVASMPSVEKEVISVTTPEGKYLIDEEPVEFFKKLQEYEEQQEQKLSCY